MGWNDHDDRILDIADMFEAFGIDETRAYEMALEIRTNELCDGEIYSDETINGMALDEITPIEFARCESCHAEVISEQLISGTYCSNCWIRNRHRYAMELDF